LNLALYSGHGDFPRAIFAPATIESAFEISGKAVELADEIQIPVLILTDQYFVDSYYNVAPFELSKEDVNRRIVKTTPDYRRYRFTDSGISPRGIPGYGDGIVKVDSDEHDENGHITESFEIRKKMFNKRSMKTKALIERVIKPIEHYRDDANVLVIGWGSTYHTIKEAIALLNNPRINQMHFEQLYPLPPKIGKTFEGYDRVVFVENNATGQFAELVCKETRFSHFDKILKYDGVQFSVEELKEKIKKIVEEV
jgi:2-oxoglutarate ferredoxin oxidoreductase subunit alpha